MGSVVDFLNQPIVLTIITLAIGSYLVSMIADKRARDDKRRNNAIEFLADVGSLLNGAVTAMYGSLRTGKPYTEEAAMEAFKGLYSKRMNVRVASEAYLRSQSFPAQYDRILTELEGVASFLMPLRKNRRTTAVIESIHERRTRLREVWPLGNEPPQAEADSPSGELMLWLDLILHRVTELLSSTLNAVMG